MQRNARFVTIFNSIMQEVGLMVKNGDAEAVPFIGEIESIFQQVFCSSIFFASHISIGLQKNFAQQNC